MNGSCAHCGIFSHLNAYKLCETCFMIDDQILQEAREILRGHGKLSLRELSDEIGISPLWIYAWLSQGRLSPYLFKNICPLCGKEIFTGGFCHCTKISTLAESCPSPEKTISTTRVLNKKYRI